MNAPFPSLLSLTPNELGKRLGSYTRACRIWKLLREGRSPYDDGQLGPGERKRLEQAVSAPVLTLDRQSIASCGTRKLMLRLHDGHFIESVIIPGKDRSTLCISSQVGCIRGCTFCMTATMGIIRNLSVEEIVGQVCLALQEIKNNDIKPLRNIVYMGMGEPLDNFTALENSLSLLTHEHALRLSPRYITVSTVGTTPKKILQLKKLRAKLAWSVHASEDALRRELVPTTRHSMQELRGAFIEVMEESRDALMIEITLLKGQNDRLQDAEHLAAFLQAFPHGVKVNLIPVNPGRKGASPSEDRQIQQFAGILQAAGHYCSIRTTRGQDSNAACGQLVIRQHHEEQTVTG